MNSAELSNFLENLSVFEQQCLAFFIASIVLWLVWWLFSDHHSDRTMRDLVLYLFYGAIYCIVILCTLPVSIPCLILAFLLYFPISNHAEKKIKESKEYSAGKNLLDAQKAEFKLKQEISSLESKKVHEERALSAHLTLANTKIQNAEEALKRKTAQSETRIAELTNRKAQLESELATLSGQIAFKRIVTEKKLQSVLEDEERKLKIQAQHIHVLMDAAKSSLTTMPYMAKIIADFDTRNLEILARQLEWGDNQERRKKVRSIRELRKETANLLAHYKEAEYKLAYAIAMFPALSDFLDEDYHDIPELKLSDLTDDSNHDRVRNYLSNEEYRQLPSAERNQLALDRYRASRRKTNWQIGRDYEMYVGYKYEQKGYRVDYHGVRKGLEDLGRDLIAVGKGHTLIIQCKYWSSSKTIHEKHITQLYGTMVCYCYENNLPRDQVLGVLVTNIKISDTARKFAEYLGIGIAEEFPFGEYPCIKCNINHSAAGGTTHIYHLPFDQQYDSCIISSPGEFMAMTTAEAEAAGFRRAYRWHSQ